MPVKCPEYPVLEGFCGFEEWLSRLNPAGPCAVWRVMSPTSYQAAPPREMMISDAQRAVKRIPAFYGIAILLARLVSGSRLDEFEHSVAQEIVLRVHG